MLKHMTMRHLGKKKKKRQTTTTKVQIFGKNSIEGPSQVPANLKKVE